jgi:tetratricopeptide (TPR) repeat protein
MNKDFSIISQEDYNNRISKGKDVIIIRYLIVQDLDKKVEDIFVTKDEDAILSKFSYMLKKNMSSLIENYIMNHDTSIEINTLIRALYHFSKKQYSQSLSYLEKFENKKYSFLKLLLIADGNYELLSDKKNYKPVIELYQEALDNANIEQHKVLIINRIKYIKYK